MLRASLLSMTRRADFLAAAQSGHKFIKPTLIVQCRLRAEADNRYIHDPHLIRTGFTATRKLGGAVIRNRAKRRMRAAARCLLPELGLQGCDYVFIARKEALHSPYDTLIRDMKHALKRLAAFAASPSTTASPS